MLVAVGRREEAVAEDEVVGVDDAWRGAEAALEGDDRAADLLDGAACGVVGVHVGAAEAVDGLLRVADDVEAVRVALEEDAAEDGPLRFVRVLELVDQGGAVAAAQLAHEGRPARTVEGIPYGVDHVGEVDLAAARFGDGEALGDGGQEARCEEGDGRGGGAREGTEAADQNRRGKDPCRWPCRGSA